MKINYAILPVAGLGTRLLPATKAIPKEMFPVRNKPVVQYIVNEAMDAGIKKIIFVTAPNKTAIKKYFGVNKELEAELKKNKKTDLLKKLEETKLKNKPIFVVQKKPLGLGHAILCTRRVIKNEPFAVLLPDMVMDSKVGCLKQMTEMYKKTGGNVIAVQKCNPDEVSNYGIIKKQKKINNGFVISDMVEKPNKKNAPSNLMINGRYILQPQIFDVLGKQKKTKGGEIQLTDAMKTLLGCQPFYALEFKGKTFDCGSVEGFVNANNQLAKK